MFETFARGVTCRKEEIPTNKQEQREALISYIEFQRSLCKAVIQDNIHVEGGMKLHDRLETIYCPAQHLCDLDRGVLIFYCRCGLLSYDEKEKLGVTTIIKMTKKDKTDNAILELNQDNFKSGSLYGKCYALVG